ncbi:MAG: NADPH-dependent F420 reductase [Chloroflexi bacterium]|nr:NADPH-dependent F420 reductase [Chloroflexota bacterium]
MPNRQPSQSPNHPTSQSPFLAIIGGTGKQGTALAARFAKAGVRVLIGSREAARAENAAKELNARLGGSNAEGYSNHDAAANAEIVLLALPYDGMKPTLQDIREACANKIVINIASALDPARKSRARVPLAGSITAEVQDFLGGSVKVVAAFQNISPEKLEGAARIDADVLVCGADREARDKVIELIKRIRIDAFDAGALENAVVVETLTAALIAINIKYKVKGAGIRITGVPR